MTAKRRRDRPVRMAAYRSVGQADAALRGLHDAGFRDDEITVICPAALHEKFARFHEVEPAGSHTAAAVAEGGAVGALLAGVVAATAIVTTGGTALAAVGPLVAAVEGGAIAGGFVGAMMTRGVERSVADEYDQALEEGQILVAVQATGTDAEARLAAAERALAAAGAHPLPLEAG
jgi:hypothetical protein